VIHPVPFPLGRFSGSTCSEIRLQYFTSGPLVTVEYVHKYLHWFAQNRNYATGTYRVIIDDFRSPVCCGVGQYRANAAFVLTGTVRISGYLCCTRGGESRPRRPRPASRISAPWCQVCDGGTERRTPEPKKFHPNLKPEPEITIIYNARAHLADRPIWRYVIKHRQFSNRRLCGVVACTRPILSGCAVLGFWSLSGAVEDRQRDEFWTGCQVQLLLAAVILTDVGRSRGFMLSKVKLINAADGDI
jgi:hypothetical protein